MTANAVRAESVKGASNFSVLIAWKGAEDKPYYRALLVSATRATLIDNKPFWGYAVISSVEFDRVMDILEGQNLNLIKGTHQGNEPEYYLEVDTNGEKYYRSLGFDRNNPEILIQLAKALEAANQKPILDIVARISSQFS
jgi:hypothetical protein